MKTTILIIITFFLLASCTKDNPTSSQLPPETQTGANTFGVTINGKVYIPRDPTGLNVGGTTPRGISLSGLYSNNYNYSEIIIVDGASAIGFKLTIHIENLDLLSNYPLKQSNFQSGVDSVSLTHLFFKIWDTNITNYAYYGSVEGQGIIVITRNSNGIISGKFSGKFVRYDNPNEFITITDGRFDINSLTVQNHPFP